MQVKQIKSDYEVIDFSDISEKYDPESRSICNYPLFDFIKNELKNMNPHIIYDGEQFYILYKLDELAIKLTNFSYDDEDLEYMRHQSNNFRKFLDDYKLTVSNIWLDFGYWLNVVDVIGRL